MHPIRAIVVDDEPLAVRLLVEILGRFSNIEVIAECSSSVDAIKQIQRLAPDLVFLDIQMPTNSGFDVVREIHADVMPLVVFVTAYDEFALPAFEVNAVDYLLKPYSMRVLPKHGKKCWPSYNLCNQSKAGKNNGQVMVRHVSLV